MAYEVGYAQVPCPPLRESDLGCANKPAHSLQRSTRNSVGIELEPELDEEFRITAMDVLAESTQIDGVTTELGPLHVADSRTDGMVGQCHGVQHARLAGAVGAVDQGDGTERDTLLE